MIEIELKIDLNQTTAQDVSQRNAYFQVKRKIHNYTGRVTFGVYSRGLLLNNKNLCSTY